MIDPHAHLRDWRESHKETLEHGLGVALRAGLDGVFEMPNTNPALTSRETILRRIRLADDAHVPIFHGLYAGVTDDPKQIEEVVRAHAELFPRVVGLKMYAGNSTGNMGLVLARQQMLVYTTLAKLGYTGVLAVHCEEESCFPPNTWNSAEPFTHTLARPPESEVESIIHQLYFAGESGFKGTLYIVHVSVPESLDIINSAKEEGTKIVCGVTPHHCMLYDEMMKGEDGLLLKMNPPLRSKEMQEAMLQALIDGEIDWIESDHAYHKPEEKTGKALNAHGEPMFASGIPVFPYYPVLIKLLREEKGMRQERINALTHHNIIRTFGIDHKLIVNTGSAGTQSEEEIRAFAGKYEFDPFANVREMARKR